MVKRIGLLVSMLALVAGLLAPTAGAEVDPNYGWDYRSMSLPAGLIPLRGGFIGDRGSDILWYQPGSGVDTLWYSVPGQRGAASFGRKTLSINGRYTPILGDFAGDWHTDILWYAPGTAADSLWIASGDPAAPFTSKPLSINGTFQAMSLFDGAGEPEVENKDDIVFYANGSAKDYLWHFDDSGSGTFTTQPLILDRTFKFLAGDFNGDFRADLLLYAPGTAADLQWFFKADGTHTTKTGPRLDGTDYQPVLISQAKFDSALLWRSGAATDAYFQGTSAGLSQKGLRQGGWNGVATGMNSAAVIVEPERGDIYFDAPDAPGDFYDLASSTHDVAPGTQAISGDFDSDGYLDIIWYSPTGKDQLWYSITPASAHTRSAAPGTDRALADTKP